MRTASPLLALVGAAAAAAALLLGTIEPAAGAAVGVGSRNKMEPMKCPMLEIELKTSVNAYKGTYAGKSVTLTGKVRNAGGELLENVAVGFHLPADGSVCRTKASLYPNPRSQEVAFHADSGANVYWEGFTLGAGKWRKFEVKAEVSAALAEAGGELEIGAVAYVVDGAFPCATAAEPVKIKVQPLGPGRTTTNSHGAVCSADPAAPDARRALAKAAANQRCGEAHEVIVSDERRPAATGVRKLPTVVTRDTCHAQCSEEGFRPPFYMSVERTTQGTQRCYCSHSCQPIHRSGVEVLQVNKFATLPFGQKAARRR